MFHGVPDAKSAHIYLMNQATRSHNKPSSKPIPFKFQQSFGKFVKPNCKVEELQQQMAGVSF